jgi:hypothetical protein
MLRIARAATAVAVAFAAAALPLLAATPAHATTDDCVDYLVEHEYDLKPGMFLGCREGENQNLEECEELLAVEGVWPWHATEACELAAREW